MCRPELPSSCPTTHKSVTFRLSGNWCFKLAKWPLFVATKAVKGFPLSQRKSRSHVVEVRSGLCIQKRWLPFIAGSGWIESGATWWWRSCYSVRGSLQRNGDLSVCGWHLAQNGDADMVSNKQACFSIIVRILIEGNTCSSSKRFAEWVCANEQTCRWNLSDQKYTELGLIPRNR